jgi:hypothetical protein
MQDTSALNSNELMIVARRSRLGLVKAHGGTEHHGGVIASDRWRRRLRSIAFTFVRGRWPSQKSYSQQFKNDRWSLTILVPWQNCCNIPAS